MISRITLCLYLATLALLPWSWFPPFPWLHSHAQWSDAVFALTAIFWVLKRWRSGEGFAFGRPHVAMVSYFGFAALSLVSASTDLMTGTMKLLGIAELCFLAAITADMVSGPKVTKQVIRVICCTSLVAAAAAAIGLILFYAQIPTLLIGSYGGLTPSDLYARVRAGTNHPNLLASFGIFAAAVVSRRDAGLPEWLRRLTIAALAMTVLMTFSRGILGFMLAAAVRAAVSRRRRILTAAFAFSVLVMLVPLSIWDITFNSVQSFETEIYSIDQTGRWYGIVSSWKTLVSSPLTGSGTGTSPGSFDGYPYDAHLTPLNIAATMGLPALAAFSALIFFLWRGRERPTDIAIWSGLAGMGLDAMTQDIEDFRHLWVMFGLGMKKVERKN